MPVLASFGAASAKNFGFTRKVGATAGQISYTSAGTYSFTVPSGATKVSIMAVNGGGAGSPGRQRGVRYTCPCTGEPSIAVINTGGAGGAGGAFKWYNCLSVSAGATITVKVGSGGIAYTCSAGPSCSSKSYVTYQCVLYANETNYSALNYGGGAGSGSSTSCCGTAVGGPGGGAAGWGSAGGNGCSGGSSTYGGAGGGSYQYGGGGVGILTRGTGGASGGAGGSGGTNGGAGGSGGTYGGGGAGGTQSGCTSYAGFSGGVGAVRILWTYTGGPARQYPATNTGNL